MDGIALLVCGVGIRIRWLLEELYHVRDLLYEQYVKRSFVIVPDVIVYRWLLLFGGRAIAPLSDRHLEPPIFDRHLERDDPAETGTW